MIVSRFYHAVEQCMVDNNITILFLTTTHIDTIVV